MSLLVDAGIARHLANQFDPLVARLEADRRGDAAYASWLADLFDLACGRMDGDEGLPVPRDELHNWGTTVFWVAWLVGVSDQAVTKRARAGKLRAWQCFDCGEWRIDPSSVQAWRDERDRAGKVWRNPRPDVLPERGLFWDAMQHQLASGPPDPHLASKMIHPSEGLRR